MRLFNGLSGRATRDIGAWMIPMLQLSMQGGSFNIFDIFSQQALQNTGLGQQNANLNLMSMVPSVPSVPLNMSDVQVQPSVFIQQNGPINPQTTTSLPNATPVINDPSPTVTLAITTPTEITPTSIVPTQTPVTTPDIQPALNLPDSGVYNIQFNGNYLSLPNGQLRSGQTPELFSKGTPDYFQNWRWDANTGQLSPISSTAKMTFALTAVSWFDGKSTQWWSRLEAPDTNLSRLNLIPLGSNHVQIQLDENVANGRSIFLSDYEPAPNTKQIQFRDATEQTPGEFIFERIGN